LKLTVKRFEELTTEELYRLLQLRVSVFVVEQNCPYPELDGLDRDAIHVWLEEDGKILAYLRVMDRGAESEDVSIGRVLATERRRGLGTRVLQEGIRAAEEYFGAERIYLEAQVPAKSLYERQGFRAVSDVFPLDGIPHVKMILECGR
jgi:ElaA protein